MGWWFLGVFKWAINNFIYNSKGHFRNVFHQIIQNIIQNGYRNSFCFWHGVLWLKIVEDEGSERHLQRISSGLVCPSPQHICHRPHAFSGCGFLSLQSDLHKITRNHSLANRWISPLPTCHINDITATTTTFQWFLRLCDSVLQISHGST